MNYQVPQRTRQDAVAIGVLRSAGFTVEVIDERPKPRVWLAAQARARRRSR